MQELDGHDQHDVASAAVLQADTVSLPARRIVECSAKARTWCHGPTPNAWHWTSCWAGTATSGADSAAAAIFQVWSGHVARRVVADGPTTSCSSGTTPTGRSGTAGCCPRSRAAFSRATPGPPVSCSMPSTTRSPSSGRDSARIRRPGAGALHRVRLAHPLAGIPGLEPLFTAVDAEVGGDESTVAQTAFDGRTWNVVVLPSWRAVYDLADLDEASACCRRARAATPRARTGTTRPHCGLPAARIRFPSRRPPSRPPRSPSCASRPLPSRAEMPKSKGRHRERTPAVSRRAAAGEEAAQGQPSLVRATVDHRHGRRGGRDRPQLHGADPGHRRQRLVDVAVGGPGDPRSRGSSAPHTGTEPARRRRHLGNHTRVIIPQCFPQLWTEPLALVVGHACGATGGRAWRTPSEREHRARPVEKGVVGEPAQAPAPRRTTCIRSPQCRGTCSSPSRETLSSVPHSPHTR